MPGSTSCPAGGAGADAGKETVKTYDQSAIVCELKAEKPLSEAQVTVVADPAHPGEYKAQMLLRPHFMLRKIDVSLRLVAQLDAKK